MITIPSIQDLYNSYVSDIEAEFGITLPTEGRNFLRAFAAVQAAKMKLLYLAVGNTQKNIWPDSADPESLGGTLERFGRVRLNRNPFPAQAAKYEIQVSGTIGSTINAGQIFRSDDDSLNPGQLYILDAGYTTVADPDFITVRALTPGIEGGQNIGNTMTATSPILGIASGVEVVSEIVEPKAAETTEAYRQAVLNSFKLEAQGGAVGDYRIWASDVQGVRTVYVYSAPGTTTAIDVYIEANPADSTDGNGTPSASMILEVEDVVDLNPDISLPINERGRRPAGAFPTYYPVTPLAVEIDISGFVGITPTLQTQIEDAIESLLFGIRPFIPGADDLSSKNDILDINRIISRILSVAPGAIFGTVTLQVNGNPVSTFTFTQGNIPYFDDLTFS